MADIVARNPLIKSPTPRERAIGEANAAVAEIDHDIIRRAGSPDIAEVPVEYLPARAEARSVDVWDPLWPDDIKRAAIEAAPTVHRHKGTVYAVKRVLAALQVEAVVTEWWQLVPRGRPYTFTVRALVRARLYDGPLLDARTLSVVYASIARAKPASRAFDLTAAASLRGSPALAPVLIGKVTLGRALVPRPATDLRASLGLAPVVIGRVRVACTMILRPPLD